MGSDQDHQPLRIVFLDAYTLSPGDLDLSPLHALGQVTLYDRTRPAETLSRCLGQDIIITNKVVLEASTLEKLSDVKLICVAATGYNNIDVAACRERQIPVTNVVGYSTPAVAQHVFAMILSHTNRSCRYYDQVREGRWSSSPDFSYWTDPIPELKGKRLGIAGFGRIGREVAVIARAFGMHVGVFSRSRPEAKDVTFMTFDTLLKSSDYISLHLPLNDDTKKLVNAGTLKMMKPGAVLINTGRGGLIDENALAQALNDKTISAAYLDVLTEEPPPGDHALLGCPRCFITPHHAWASIESRQRLLDALVQTIQAFQIDGPLDNLV